MNQHHACTNGNNVRSLRFTQMCGINSPTFLNDPHVEDSNAHLGPDWDKNTEKAYISFVLAWTINGLSAKIQPYMGI